MAADPLTSRTVDNLLAEDIDFDFDDDPFADSKPPENTTRDDKATLSPRKRKAAADDPFGGNVDEEIKIVKQRAKIPKLDVERLCSKPGIPQIRELIQSGKLKKKLRLKGKGHEFSDVARLLNYYQIWLDQLYPRAKFADALQLVEKAGHNKRMQVMRKAWIDEGKPWYSRREEPDTNSNRRGTGNDIDSEKATKDEKQPIEQEDEDGSMMFIGTDTAPERERDMTGPEDDELDFLLAQDHQMPSAKAKDVVDVESEGEDDLDALLAEQEIRKQKSRPTIIEDDEDDLEALLQEQDTYSEHDRTKTATKPPPPDTNSNNNTDEDQDDLDAILNDDLHHNTMKSATSPPEAEEITEDFDNDFEDNDLDDLDTMLAQRQTPNRGTEPDLPPIATTTPMKLIPESAAQDIAPDSEEVPELDNVISSSPIPNVRTDELDELMDEHDAKINRGRTHTPQKPKDDSQLVEQFMSSSPIPNET